MSGKDAFLADEVARLASDYAAEFDRPSGDGPVTHQAVHQWAKSSGLARRGSRPAYSAAASPGPAISGDIPAATAQLAAGRGEPVTDTERQLVALAAGRDDEESMTAAIMQMNAAPAGTTHWLLVLSQTSPDDASASLNDHAVAEVAANRGETYERTYEQVRGLTGGERTVQAVRQGILDLNGMRPSETVALSVLSMDERRKPSAHTIDSSTDFPIPDIGHLRAAIARFKEGKLAGHSAAEVKAHILKAAQRLGVKVDLDGGDDDGKKKVAASTVALTAGQPVLSERTRMTLYRMGMLGGPGDTSDNLIQLSGLGPGPGSSGTVGLAGTTPAPDAHQLHVEHVEHLHTEHVQHVAHVEHVHHEHAEHEQHLRHT